MTGGWMGQVGCRVRLGFFVLSLLFDSSSSSFSHRVPGKKKGLRERFTRISKHVFKSEFKIILKFVNITVLVLILK
jgi:hypothetical protein